MTAKRNLTGHMDIDGPIWAVVENETCNCLVSRLQLYLMDCMV